VTEVVADGLRLIAAFRNTRLTAHRIHKGLPSWLSATLFKLILLAFACPAGCLQFYFLLILFVFTLPAIF